MGTKYANSAKWFCGNGEKAGERESTVFANNSNSHVTCYWNHKAIWHIVDFIEFVDWDQENMPTVSYNLRDVWTQNFEFWSYCFKGLLTLQYEWIV